MTTTYRPAEPRRTTAPRAATAPQAATGPPEPYGTDDHTPTATGTGTGPGPRLWAPRGRHRRPRPRKVLLAAGGMALAAGVLGLVRMTPESGVASLGTAEAEPRPDSPAAATGTDRATTTAATVPEASPSATAVLGGASATPLRTVRLAPTSSTTTAPPTPAPGTTTVPDTTGIPDAPNPPGSPAPADTPRWSAPADTTTPRPARTPSLKPTPAPRPSHTPAAPTPEPRQPGQGHPHRPGLCMPIIGVCVDPLNH
ncbi:hypothetical protein ACFYRY_15850 [Streptomyces sp. NPDC005263]|uniref:hypothetical protein n=1 Tax=Streptomyces sp. NPDC005263 TaxID=3364711 RepID=UPI00369CEC8E